MNETRKFLSARWIHLAMLNYEVDPAILTKYVPSGTELDSFDGKTFVSMVGFQFLDTRVLGLPIPFHRNFEEVNLRFYVRCVESGELRRGVVFIKEIVPRPAIAWVARVVYNENYVALPMSHRDELGIEPNPLVEYGWEHRGRRDAIRLRVEGDSYLPDELSEEAFITEHYWGYVPQRNGGTLQYQVEHPRWKVWRATDAEFVCDVSSLYGAEFVPALSQMPSSAFLAEGSAVTVRRGQFLNS